MGLKENFNQALKELINKGGLVGSELEEKSKTKSNLDSYLDMPAKDEPASHGQSVSGFDQESSRLAMSMGETDWQNPPNFEDHTVYQSDGYTSAQSGDYGRMFRQSDEMTVISKSTMIVGDIRTLANITIDGNVRGKVDVLKDANIRGMLIGDLVCSNTEMKGSSVQGNVFAKGSTYIDNDSILLGDLTAQFASIDGKVKGNIEIGSKIELHPNAIVAGDINTNTISIADGANIKGFINTTFLKEHGDSAFPKQVIMENAETNG
ncbi:MAG: polymer-forming cytoskeletal protein [Clostridiales bacterium]|nr:polymer-forming cytoskeletal protein [Clostridiales bacterium]